MSNIEKLELLAREEISLIQKRDELQQELEQLELVKKYNSFVDACITKSSEIADAKAEYLKNSESDIAAHEFAKVVNKTNVTYDEKEAKEWAIENKKEKYLNLNKSAYKKLYSVADEMELEFTVEKYKQYQFKHKAFTEHVEKENK